MINLFAAEYLKYADKVLLAANGQVKDCGRGEETVSKDLVDVIKSSDKSGTEHKNKLKEPDVTSKAARISEVNELNDLSKPTGDLDVYRYYLKSVGWPKMALFVAFVTMDVFSSSFSSKSSITWQRESLLTNPKTSGSSGGLRLMGVRLHST